MDSKGLEINLVPNVISINLRAKWERKNVGVFRFSTYTIREDDK